MGKQVSIWGRLMKFNYNALNNKRVLFLQRIDHNYHLNILCPMVQKPINIKREYKIGYIQRIKDNMVRIKGVWYHPCCCVDRVLYELGDCLIEGKIDGKN
jgi:hypothetical protein